MRHYVRQCPSCGCDECCILGRLGRLIWFRCRACGIEFSTDVRTEEDSAAITLA